MQRAFSKPRRKTCISNIPSKQRRVNVLVNDMYSSVFSFNDKIAGLKEFFNLVTATGLEGKSEFKPAVTHFKI